MWTPKKSTRAWNAIRTYGRPYRAQLFKGSLATIGVVLFRLAIPWPLRGVLELISSTSGATLLDRLPPVGEPIFWLVGSYVLFAVGVGFTEMVQRVAMRKFAAQTVHDMRSVAVRSANQRARTNPSSIGDLIARIIGDTARIKAGMTGILVHVTQNGLLFVGVCAIMLYLSPQLGGYFLLAGLLALIIGFRASKAVAATVDKQRRKEGEYARASHDGISRGGLDAWLDRINLASSRKEVRTAKLIARASLNVHVVLAIIVGLALWSATNDVAAGYLAPGEVFLFIAYAWTIHKRMVQVGRQAARSGKVLACTNRVAALIDQGATTTSTPPDGREQPALRSGLRMHKLRLRSLRKKRERPRLKNVDADVRAGEHLLVLGGMGSGKSSLLRVLAGVETPNKGALFWDDEDVTKRAAALRARVDYLPQDPAFPRACLWEHLGLDGPEVSEEEQRTLVRIGAWRIVTRLSLELSTRLSSQQLSRNEARSVVLGSILLHSGASVWLLDDPTEGRRASAAHRCLEEILERAKDRTLVVAMSRPMLSERFARLLLMKQGKIKFSGTPDEYKKNQHNKAVQGVAI